MRPDAKGMRLCQWAHLGPVDGMTLLMRQRTVEQDCEKFDRYLCKGDRKNRLPNRGVPANRRPPQADRGNPPRREAAGLHGRLPGPLLDRPPSPPGPSHDRDARPHPRRSPRDHPRRMRSEPAPAQGPQPARPGRPVPGATQPLRDPLPHRTPGRERPTRSRSTPGPPVDLETALPRSNPMTPPPDPPTTCTHRKTHHETRTALSWQFKRC